MQTTREIDGGRSSSTSVPLNAVPVVQEALVERVLDRRLLLRLGTARVWALLALPVAYQPEVGDRVLALAQAGRAWVIGVIEGRGATVFDAPGDLVLRARGTLQLHAHEGIEMHTDGELSVRAQVFRSVFDKVRERIGSVFRVVRGAVRMRAGEVREDVQGDHRCRAGRVLAKARGHVRIDGEQIHLG